MKNIRLWSDQFSPLTIQYNNHHIVSELRLVTRLVWTDPAFNVGFVLSAYRDTPREQRCIVPSLGHFTGSRSASGSFRFTFDEVLIRDNYLLALFEGFNVF